MCIIIDVHVFTTKPELLGNPVHVDAQPVLNWLSGSGRLVYGGRLAEEYSRVGEIRRWLSEMVRAGKARQFSKDEVVKKERDISGLCRSNDQHIIALAIVSGARILYSLDIKLGADFRNGELVKDPRGSCYTLAGHKHLLRHSSSCGVKPRPRTRRKIKRKA